MFSDVSVLLFTEKGAGYILPIRSSASPVEGRVGGVGHFVSIPMPPFRAPGGPDQT